MRAWMIAVAVVAMVVCGARGQVSPFEDVEWGEEDVPRVKVGGQWWEPVSIDGVSFAAIVSFAREFYPSEEWAQKRVDEDLFEVLEGMGEALPGETVDLVLRALDGTAEVTIPGVPLTAENRERLRDKRADVDEERERDLERDVLMGLVRSGVDRVGAGAVLFPLHALLREQHSYTAARGVDLDGVMGGVWARWDDGGEAANLAREVRRVLALSGDGHARVYGLMTMAPMVEGVRQGMLPFALVPLDLEEGGRVVAAERDGAGLVDPARPYVVALDGVPVEKWLEVAGELAPGGSAQSQRYWACRDAASVGWIRARLGIAASDVVRCAMVDGRGGFVERELLLADRATDEFRKGAGDDAEEWVEDAARGAGLNVAYVPIERMWSSRQPEFERLGEALERAGDADGVIIDIRGNTGGSRDVLHLVASHVMPRDAEPVVYSAARVLMWRGRDPVEVADDLAGRYLFRPEDARWNEREREAIELFLGGFAPEVELGGSRFGTLHVSMLSPRLLREHRWSGDGALADVPVVVLIDEKCISASDVFAAGMKVLPGVTLVGRPTRGASGMSETTEIGAHLEVKISTMVSYMADGMVFDWHGVAPDVPVELSPEDFTRDGRDTALEAAFEAVRAGR